MASRVLSHGSGFPGIDCRVVCTWGVVVTLAIVDSPVGGLEEKNKHVKSGKIKWRTKIDNSVSGKTTHPITG